MKYEHPRIPFYANVGSLGVGKKIIVKGKSEYQHQPRFCINLGIAPMFRENIALHISARHEENCIVVTHCHNGVWGVEQRLHNPIHMRERFEFKIYVKHEHYEIKLSDWSGIDHHLTNLPYIFPPAAVNHIEVEGGVKLDHIHVDGHSEGGAVVVDGMMPGMPMYRPPVMVEPVPMYRPPMVVEPMYRPPMVVEPMRPMYPTAPMVQQPMMYPQTVVMEQRPPVVVVEPPMYYEPYHHHHHHHGW